MHGYSFQDLNEKRQDHNMSRVFSQLFNFKETGRSNLSISQTLFEQTSTFTFQLQASLIVSRSFLGESPAFSRYFVEYYILHFFTYHFSPKLFLRILNKHRPNIFIPSMYALCSMLPITRTIPIYMSKFKERADTISILPHSV